MLTNVAPYVGAWIETLMSADLANQQPSHPTWVRGLKHGMGAPWARLAHVAPYVGAWIETKNPHDE